MFRALRILIIATPAIGLASHCLAQTTATAALESTSSLLSRAIKLTAQKKMEEAEQTYRSLIQVSPQDGYPALARFLARTGRTADAFALVETDPRLKSFPVLLRARTAVAVGSSSIAINLLQNSQAERGQEYEQATLLANQHELTGNRSAAAQALSEALESESLTPTQRTRLFTRLVAIGDPAMIAEALPGILHHHVTSSSLEYGDLRIIAVEGMAVLANSSSYSAFHHTLDQQRNTSGTAAWLFGLSCIRKGDTPAAIAVLDEWSTRSATAREKLVCTLELATLQASDRDRAAELYRKAVALQPDSDRLKLMLGQMLFRQGLHDECTTVIQNIKYDRLDEAERGTYTNLLLSSMAANGPLPDLIATFERLCAGLPWERLRQVAEAPFVLLQNTRYADLRALLQARVSEKGAPPELHVLRMSLENRMGDNEALLRALSAYVASRPTVADAVQEYADGMGQMAYHVATQDPKSSPSVERQKEVADSAAKALWTSIKVRPYTPEPYGKLIELYKLFGDSDKARRVPLVLCESTTATADDVHLAAYIYATNGFAPESLPLYERAMKLAPEKARFRLNYAGALGRVGRIDDALAIYDDLISKGVNGKQFHAHELYINSVRLADSQGRTAQHLEFLKSQLNNKSVPQHDLMLLETAKAYLSTRRADEATVFLNALKQQYAQHEEVADDMLVQASVEKRDFAGAETLLAAEEKQTTDSAGAILVRANMAEVKRAQGKLDAAVEIWTQIAKDYPQERMARRKMITAAQALMEASRLQQAKSLLQQYLATDTGDPDGEQLAREVMTRLKKFDVPTESIVQSALEFTTTSPGTLRQSTK